MADLPGSPSIGLLAARARDCAERFSLPLRDKNWKGRTGDHAGSGAGSSLDFQDHRAYVPGDDPRHINWQAYARSGQYSLKLYREEVRPVVEILCDVSGSMFSDEAKASRTLELLFFSIASSELSGATVSVLLLEGPRWRVLPRSALSSHAWIGELGMETAIQPSLPPRVAEVPFKPRSLRLLISDLLYPADPESFLRPLVREGGRGLVLVPFAPDEAEPEWVGNCEFKDTETGLVHQRRVDSAVLTRYRSAYRDHFARWKAASLRCQVLFGRVSSAGSFEDAVRAEAIPSGAIQLI